MTNVCFFISFFTITDNASQRTNFENFPTDIPTYDSRSVGHSARGRHNCQLTEENIANMNASRCSLREGSVASNGIESTISRTTRSLLANSRNTPKKYVTAVRPATSSRHSSRLLSENQKAVDSPKKQSAKRNLQSNVPLTTSRTRNSSRLIESQSATPNEIEVLGTMNKHPESASIEDIVVDEFVESSTQEVAPSSLISTTTTSTPIVDSSIQHDADTPKVEPADDDAVDFFNEQIETLDAVRSLLMLKYMWGSKAELPKDNFLF